MAAQKLTNNLNFQMRVSAEFLNLIDDWRRAQPSIPSRAEAVRNLVERAIAVERAEKPAGKRR